ncbi:hypothetical protein [Fibrobacter sp. UWB12]|uniref:hypothetical protein n=1 Tax=Fibrobacter sp. UWB12 TaxID=1896203 RepID=UPI00090F7C68|nr:hypothetical protein [Fibrobacter sp. UWB12]SHK77475.1 hypothetical protein SAMN05720759_106157 [Fibrobacter sp. UWB12]
MENDKINIEDVESRAKAVVEKEEDVSKGLVLFEKAFEIALKIPGVKVNRTAFLKQQLCLYIADAKLNLISEKKPYDIADDKILDVVAEATIKNHVRAVTLISAASGLPANPMAAVGLAAADMAQYFAQVLMLAQKIAYIYGFPDLMDEKENFSEVSKSMLFVLLAVAFGCKVGDQKIRLVLAALAKGVEKKLPQQALTKTWWYPIIKALAPWFGKKMTKDRMGVLLGKAIPFIGMPLSGGFTFFSFRKAAKHLKNECKKQMELFKKHYDPDKDFSEMEKQKNDGR